MEILFTGGNLSNDYKLQCTQKLQTFLTQKNLQFDTSTYAIEIESENFMLVSFKVVSNNDETHRKLQEVIADNFYAIFN